MKKLYRKGTVHPSPPVISDHLAFLPATILTLTAALSPEDREVLAYLISSSNSTFSGQRRATQKISKAVHDHDHPPLFHCDCFRCYMSFWVRWDSSPNRQLIHEIIDAFEDDLAQTKKAVKSSKKDRKKKGVGVAGGNGDGNSGELKLTDSNLQKKNLLGTESSLVGESSSSSGGDDACGSQGEEGAEKGSMRRIVNYIGERIWGVWGQ